MAPEVETDEPGELIGCSSTTYSPREPREFGGALFSGPGEHGVKVRWQVHSTLVNRDGGILHEHSNRTLFAANSESVYFPL